MSRKHSMADHKENSPVRKGAAWSVHLFTATGAAAGLMAMLAAVNGNWRTSFAWMGVAVAIDAVDGALARAFKVKQVLPGFDGALLDNIVDYFTYVIVPGFFLCEAGMMPPHGGPIIAAIIAIASGYQFCQADAKTPDHCFKGFPSYWNLVILYLFLVGWNPWANMAVVVICIVLVFVPIKYIYPTRTRALRPITLGLAGVWSFMLVAALFLYPNGHLPWTWLSLAYVLYYVLASLYFTVHGYPSTEESV